ncbi:hypothetical protein [Streptomyces sp. NPDC058861]|uniref:hypothetical protein n=1 Tax=Streptomyces sp. NPDC058861 TaxID=3346653 RepID=UPI0036B613ED
MAFDEKATSEQFSRSTVEELEGVPAEHGDVVPHEQGLRDPPVGVARDGLDATIAPATAGSPQP